MITQWLLDGDVGGDTAAYDRLRVITVKSTISATFLFQRVGGRNRRGGPGVASIESCI
jgi:hypothetical protein